MIEVTVKQLVPWSVALNAARTTSHKEDIDKEPSDSFIRSILKAEHSPIRAVMYEITMKNIPYYVSVHLVRHKFGVEHFVTTQRDDRNENAISRSDLPQGAPVTHRMIVNAQALINMSRKRLCSKADISTRMVWTLVRSEMKEIDLNMYDAMVPECIYRGFCPERNGCRYIDRYPEELNIYRR